MQTPTRRQCFVILVVLIALLLIGRRSIPVDKLSTGRQETYQLQLNLEKKIKDQERKIENQADKLVKQNSLMKTLEKKLRQIKKNLLKCVQCRTSANNTTTIGRLLIYAPSNISAERMTKVTLRVVNSHTPIYVYGSVDVISNKIIQTGRWEDKQMTQTEKLLAADKNLNFLDIGCNIGVYTILAAKMGRQVVAVDANVRNMKRLRRSLMDAKLESQVILLLNAIHQVHKSYKLYHYQVNVGSDHIFEVPEGTDDSVKSVTLDEIYDVIPFKKALLKLDIEGSEFDALHKADILFTLIDIPIVFMEWGISNGSDRNGKVQTWIKTFFHRHGYAPFKHAFSYTTLGNNHASWPWDIVWKKKTQLHKQWWL